MEYLLFVVLVLVVVWKLTTLGHKAGESKVYSEYDKEGYNSQGYNISGRNRQGKYNRLYDYEDFLTEEYSKDGFMDPRWHPIALTTHAKERLCERLGITQERQMYQQARDAYSFGRSARQIKASSAYLLREVEGKEDNTVALIYKNHIYIFMTNNVLKTVYINDRISL